jgi:branched-chain amino acid transport system ATP-binding protein
MTTNGWPPERLCRHGVSRTFQIPHLFHLMTAYETVLVAARFGPGSRAHRLRACEFAEEALSLVGFDKPHGTPVSTLNVAELKRLDLARSLACQPKLLMIDEVAAGLISSQATELLGIVRRIAERGVGVLIVEHIVRSILTVCDRLVVLEQGRVIADGPPDKVVADPGVIEAYFGQQATIDA